MHVERESVWNVAVGILTRIQDRTDWKLYVGDCCWVLDMDGHLEFYFHPQHFLGKIEKKRLPSFVEKRLAESYRCFTDADRKDKTQKEACEKALESAGISIQRLDQVMGIGNWFYAQGEIYATSRGRFFQYHPYFGGTRECDLRQISWDRVWDMLRMQGSTRTHYYLTDLFQLSCFAGMKPDWTIVKPLQGLYWNSESWKTAFAQESERLKKNQNRDSRAVIRFMRREVFQHTVHCVCSGGYKAPNGEWIALPKGKKLQKESKLYNCQLQPGAPRYAATEITVENTDCLLAAKRLQEEGFHPAVLNMANRQTPGGGVFTGAGAQEENLFRRTNLFQSLYPFSDFAELYGLKKRWERYPLDPNFGGAYSPEVTVFRGEEKEGYPLLNKPYHVAVISVAGMNRPELDGSGNIAPHLVEGVKNKIRTILDIGRLQGHDALVLGALGCGAFRNPPAHVARLFHEVIGQEYPGQFKKICFAILEDHNSGAKHNPEGNFAPFYNEFIGV